MADREAKVTFRAETAEFRQAITQANSALKNLRSGVRLVDAQMTAAGTSTDALRKKDELLKQEQTQLQSKVEALTGQHRKAIEVYGANSTEAQKYATQLNNTRRDLALCEAKIRSNNTALESAIRAEKEADSALSKLNSTISNQEHEMDMLGQAYREAVVQFGQNSKEVKDLETKIVALNTDLQDNRRIVKAADDAYEALQGELRESDSAARQMSEGFTVAKGVLSHLGSTVFQNAIQKAKELTTEVFNLGIGFEASMAKVQALSGSTAEEYAALEARARELGASTRFTASQVADGFGYMALAGWDCQSMLDGIPGVLNLAAAADMDLAQASDIVTDYLTAFGLTAQDSGKFVDQMTFAMANSNTNVEQLGEAYKNCAATAASMNYSVEDTTAALMVMANAGVKGGEAGTALNAIMTRLATDTRGCATELEEYGVHVYDAQGNMQSLSSILQGMGDVWERLTDEQQASMAKTIAGVNHYSNLQTIMGGLTQAAKEGGQGFTAYSAALETCDGSAQKMSDTMMNTAQGDLYTLQSALEEVGLKVYEKLEQPFRSVIQFLTGPGVSGLTWLLNNLKVLPPVIVAILASIIRLKTGKSVIDLVSKSAGAKLKSAFDTSSVSVNRLSREVVENEVVWKKYNATTKETTVVTGRSTASLRLQQGVLKTQALAVKGVTVAFKGLSSAFKTIAPIAALSLITDGLMKLSEMAENAAEKEEETKKATDGLKASFNSYNEAQQAVLSSANDASDAAEDYAGSLKTVAEMAAEARQHQGELADSLSESWAETGTKNAMVDQYVATIERLAGNTADSAEKQGELQAAVDGLNEIMGTSYTVVDKQNGVLNVSTDTLRANAAAWQQKALAEAASAAQSELMKQHVENQTALAKATEELEQAQNNLNSATNDFESSMYAQRLRDARAQVEELERQDKACTDEMERMNGVIGSLGEAYASTPEAIRAYIDSTESVSSMLANAGINADDFSNALSQIGISTQDLTDMTPELLEQLVFQYQNDIGGLAQWCLENGVQIPGNLASGIQQGNADVQAAAQGNVDQYEATVDAATASAPSDGASLAQASASGASSQDAAWQAAAQGNVNQYTATVNLATGQVTEAGAAYATASGNAAVAASEQGGAEAGQAQVDSYSNAVTGAQGEAEQATSQVASASARALEKVEEFRQRGVQDMAGFISGMSSKESDAVQVARRIARATIDAIKAEGGEGSPWRETKPSGRFAVQGFMEGEKQELPALIKTNQQLMREGIDALSPEALGFSWQLDEMRLQATPPMSARGILSTTPDVILQRYIDNAVVDSDRTDELIRAVESLANRVTVLEIDSMPFATAFAPAADRVNGKRQALVDRGLAQ